MTLQLQTIVNNNSEQHKASKDNKQYHKNTTKTVHAIGKNTKRVFYLQTMDLR